MGPPVQQRPAFLFVFVVVKLRPAALEEAAHGVSGLAHLRRVLVEKLAVIEDQLSVGRKLLAAAVPSLQKSFPHSEEVHGVFDDASVSRHHARIDRLQERPGV